MDAFEKRRQQLNISSINKNSNEDIFDKRRKQLEGQKDYTSKALQEQKRQAQADLNKSFPTLNPHLDTDAIMKYTGIEPIKPKTALDKKMEQQSFESQQKLPGAINKTPAKPVENFVGKIPAPVSFAAGLADTATAGLIEETANRKTQGLPNLGNRNEIAKNFFESAKAENPAAYTGGQIGGYFIPGAAAERAASFGVKTAAKAIPKIAEKALIGGIAGGTQELAEGTIRNIGSGNISKEGFADIAKRTAIGASAGIGGEFLLSGLSKGFQKLRSTIRTPAEQLAQSTEKVVIEPIKTVKPVSQQGNFTIKNSAYDKAMNDYNSAIEAIQNHFGTNELRANEIHQIKTDLGIDLDNIINRMEQAEKPVKLNNPQTMQLKRAAGVASDRTYGLSDALRKQPTSDTRPNNLNNINSQPVLSKQPTAASRNIAEDIGLRGNTQTKTLNIFPESNRVGKTSAPIPYGPKERKFSQNVQGSKDTPEYILKQLTDEKLTYNPISEKSTLDKATKRITDNADKAYSDVLTGTGKGISRDDVATGELLIKQAFEKGDNDKAYTLISHLAEKLTESGQAIQAAAMFKRMTPEGMLLYAEKAVNKANRELGKSVKQGGFADPLKKFYKKGNLTDEMKNAIKSDMDDLMKLPEGREKDVKLARVMQTISEAMPKAPLAKLESFRTIAMLSNPKTWVRNYLSNLAFGGIESGATKPLSALTDRILSLRTGQRSVLNTNLKELGKGFAEGSKNAIDDVIRNVDTSPTRGALELPRANEFKNVPILREIEKAVKLGVSGGDRPFYQAAYKDALAEQLKLYEKNTGKKILAATDEMKAAADEIAKYRTYADSNMLSNGLTKVKSGLNKMRIGGIGAGDVLMKFTRTPANLIARGIDYSPAGLIKGMVDISRVLAGNKEVQRQAAESFSRGVIGTGFVTAAITLTNLGIIRGERKKSNTANAFEQATGKGQYTFNVSALKRYIASGMDPKAAEEKQGDIVSTYDWAQPLALSTSVGANIGEDLKKKQKVDTLGLIGTIAESMSSGANTIIEQPMLQNINRVFKGDNPVQGLMSVVQDYPASFVPAFVSGMRYAADPNIRDTSGGFFESTGKRIANKIPGASQSLNKTVDLLGSERKVSAETPIGRLLDSALNPTRITKVNYTPATKEIDRLYKATADGNILPNLVEKSDTIPSPRKGESPKELTPEQRIQYQKILAENYLTRVNNLINNPGWGLLKDDLKVDRLSNARSKADTEAKKAMQRTIFGN